MHNFLYLILEGVAIIAKKAPKAHATAIRRVSSGSNWRKMSTKRRYKRLLPRRTSMFGARTLMNQTDSTRKVWDPKGYKTQKFYDNMYKTI